MSSNLQQSVVVMAMVVGAQHIHGPPSTFTAQSYVINLLHMPPQLCTGVTHSQRIHQTFNSGWGKLAATRARV
jgi:hypothetical protein